MMPSSSDPPGCGGAPGCGHASDPPPVFDLPPPPRPPWLEDLESCEDSGSPLRQLETCENVDATAMMGEGDFESAFHSVAVIVVCAVLVVIFALTLGVVIFRWGKLRKGRERRVRFNYK